MESGTGKSDGGQRALKYGGTSGEEDNRFGRCGVILYSGMIVL